MSIVLLKNIKWSLFLQLCYHLMCAEAAFLLVISVGMDLLPAANEIVFGIDAEIGQATMTWCYPHPKILLSLKVTPIPFTLPTQWDSRLVDETFRVRLVYFTII